MELKVAVGQSITSGILAAIVSLIGKFTFTSNISPLAQVSLVVVMIFTNMLMWTIFSKALDSSRSSVEVSVVNTASNFISSAFFGWVFFNERVILKPSWVMGFGFILLGLYVLLSSHSSQSISMNKDKKK